jgi:hypothetical protein
MGVQTACLITKLIANHFVMKNFNPIITLLILFLPISAFAQTIVSVSPGLGTLNDAIADYIASNGETSMDVVFELEDGGVYVLTETLENEFPLRIEAESNAAVRPAILPNVPVGDAFRAFRVREDITLRGLYITNEDALGNADDQIVRISKDDARIIVDNCHLDKASQSAFRLDNNGNKLYITNTVISNIGNLSNPSNGRGIDDRGNNIDTLWVENTTFYNLTARVLRDDGGLINWTRWNHVTTVHSGDRSLDLGEALEVEVTNCLFVNPAFLGDDEPGSSAFQIDSADVVQMVSISNNNFYFDPAIQAVYDDLNVGAAVGDSIYPRVSFNGDAISFITAAQDTNFNLAVSFNDPPAAPTEYISSFFTNPDDPEPLDDGNGGLGMGQVQLPFDFGYSTSDFLYTAGTDMLPVGDLNWHDLTTNTNEPGLAEQIELTVFPNPTSDRTQINFELEQADNVRLVLFNQMGQQIGNTMNSQLNRGSHFFELDLTLMPKGVYYFRLETSTSFYGGQIVKQ